jgi:hypothetical protein
MRADETRCKSQLGRELDDARLRATDVSDQLRARRVRRNLAQHLGGAVDGHGDDDQIRLAHTSERSVQRLVDASRLHCVLHVAFVDVIGANSNAARGQIASERSADEPQPDDCGILERRHARPSS